MSEEKPVKIIQVTAAEKAVFGLGEDGKVYLWLQRGPDDIPHWEVYCRELMRLT